MAEDAGAGNLRWPPTSAGSCLPSRPTLTLSTKRLELSKELLNYLVEPSELVPSSRGTAHLSLFPTRIERENARNIDTPKVWSLVSLGAVGAPPVRCLRRLRIPVRRTLQVLLSGQDR